MCFIYLHDVYWNTINFRSKVILFSSLRSILAGPSGNMVENIWSWSSYLKWYEVTSWQQKNDKTYFQGVSSICMMKIGMQLILELRYYYFLLSGPFWPDLVETWLITYSLDLHISNDMKRFLEKQQNNNTYFQCVSFICMIYIGMQLISDLRY